MKFEEQVISYPTPTFKQSLWLEDPHCRCCGRPTRLLKMIGGKAPGDMATIEHRYPRGHPLRSSKHPLYETARMVRTLFCAKCNADSDEYFKRTKQLYSYSKSAEYRFLQQRCEHRRKATQNPYIIIPKHKSLIPYGRFQMVIHIPDSRHAMCDSDRDSKGEKQGNPGMYLSKVRPPYYPRHGYNCWGAE